MNIDITPKSLTGIAAGIALGLTSLDAIAQAQTTYTYFVAEGTAPAFNTAADVNNNGEVVGTNFEWVPPSPPSLIAPPLKGFTQSIPVRAVNDLGAMTGTAEFRRIGFSAFVRENGRTRPIARRDTSSSVGTDINNQGDIVGFRRPDGSSVRRAFLFRDGGFTDLGSLAGQGDDPATNNAEANAVNANTQIVGQATDGNGQRRAFLWENGTITDLGTLVGAGGLGGAGGFVRSSAQGINDIGHVVGWSEERAEGGEITPLRAFVWRGDAMQSLGTLSGTSSQANDINNADVIVGQFLSNVASVGFDSMETHAAVWVDGEGIDLNAPGVVTNLPADITLEVATAINDSGMIVGHTCDRQCAPGKSRVGKPFALIPNN